MAVAVAEIDSTITTINGNVAVAVAEIDSTITTINGNEAVTRPEVDLDGITISNGTEQTSSTATAVNSAENGGIVGNETLLDSNVNISDAATTAEITAVDNANGNGEIYVAEYELSGAESLVLASLHDSNGLDVTLLAEINTATDTAVNNVTITLADVLAIGEDLDLSDGIIDTNGSDNVKDILITSGSNDVINILGWQDSTQDVTVNGISYNKYTNSGDNSVALYISDDTGVVLS